MWCSFTGALFIGYAADFSLRVCTGHQSQGVPIRLAMGVYGDVASGGQWGGIDMSGITYRSGSLRYVRFAHVVADWMLSLQRVGQVHHHHPCRCVMHQLDRVQRHRLYPHDLLVSVRITGWVRLPN